MYIHNFCTFASPILATMRVIERSVRGVAVCATENIPFEPDADNTDAGKHQNINAILFADKIVSYCMKIGGNVLSNE